MRLRIDYTNWREERSIRVVIPIRIEYTSNEWHKDPCWLMFAYDEKKKEVRTFPLASIHATEEVQP